MQQPVVRVQTSVNEEEHTKAGADKGLAIPKVSINNLAVFYGKFRAVTDINMDIQENKITAIIGPSGCGKSTLLRSLNRMNDLTPNARVDGEIILDGQNINAAGVDVVDVRRRVGMVFQRPNPFPKSIYDNVAYGPRLYGVRRKRDLDEIVEKSLKQAALWDEVKDKIHQSGLSISGGQQQRLCIARRWRLSQRSFSWMNPLPPSTRYPLSRSKS